MNYETKHDVFEGMKWELIRNLANTIDQNGGLRPLEDATKVGENYATRYVAALPDDLPVIPEAVGVSIKEQKAKQSLGGALFDAIFSANELGRKNVGPVVNWMVDNDETYANAWLTGVWCVEETGKIVKLEEIDDGD